MSILSLASPALERMLSSAMVEGRTKRVAVRDTPKAAMELFPEIVHTGCVSAEEEDDDATEESDESADTDAVKCVLVRRHRRPRRRDRRARARAPWNTDDVLALLENLLAKKLTDDNFASFAAAAQSSAARARSSTRVSRTPRARPRQAAADAGEYSAAVLELLGKAPAGEPSRKKRRLQSLRRARWVGSEHRCGNTFNLRRRDRALFGCGTRGSPSGARGPWSSR